MQQSRFDVIDFQGQIPNVIIHDMINDFVLFGKRPTIPNFLRGLLGDEVSVCTSAAGHSIQILCDSMAAILHPQAGPNIYNLTRRSYSGMK